MERIVLKRTHLPDIGFHGELVKQLRSQNHERHQLLVNEFPNRPQPHQWFEVDIYRTTSDNYVVRVGYRAGLKLRGEKPVDVVVCGRDPGEIVDKMAELDPEVDFVTGFAKNIRDKFTGEHQSIVNYAVREFDDVYAATCEYLNSLAGVEEIV